MIAQIKLYGAIGLLALTFILGVKVTRDWYQAKEARAKIEQLETAIEVRDRLTQLLRTHLEAQERTSAAHAERIKQYEDYLRTRPGSCTLDSNDLRWMQPLRRPRSAPAR